MRQGPVKEWETVTEHFIKNTVVLPLTQDFHPVYVAAAYLAFTKEKLHLLKAQKEAMRLGNQKLAAAQIDLSQTKPDIPDVIAGHAWFKFVD